MRRNKELSIGVLNDYYGALLTVHQSEMVHLYFDCDFSYQEIADEYGVTRQGVCDVIARSQQKLKEYEEKLGLAAKLQAVKEQLSELLPLATGQLKEGLERLQGEIEGI